jgi:hypothetical protein
MSPRSILRVAVVGRAANRTNVPRQKKCMPSFTRLPRIAALDVLLEKSA